MTIQKTLTRHHSYDQPWKLRTILQWIICYILEPNWTFSRWWNYCAIQKQSTFQTIKYWRNTEGLGPKFTNFVILRNIHTIWSCISAKTGTVWVLKWHQLMQLNGMVRKCETQTIYGQTVKWERKPKAYIWTLFFHHHYLTIYTLKQ